MPEVGAAQQGCAAEGQGGFVLVFFFPFFSVSVTGRGIKTAVQNIFEEL